MVGSCILFTLPVSGFGEFICVRYSSCWEGGTALGHRGDSWFSVRLFILAQVTIAGSWNRAPCRLPTQQEVAGASVSLRSSRSHSLQTSHRFSVKGRRPSCSLASASYTFPVTHFLHCVLLVLSWSFVVKHLDSFLISFRVSPTGFVFEVPMGIGWATRSCHSPVWIVPASFQGHKKWFHLCLSVAAVSKLCLYALCGPKYVVIILLNTLIS